MNKRIIVALICALMLLVAFTGCKKEEAKTDGADNAAVKADEAKADEAKAEAPKADEAKAEAPKADEVKAEAAPAAEGGEPDMATAADTVANFFKGMDEIAKASGEDCTALADKMSAHMAANKDKFVASMKVLAKVDEESPEFKALEEKLKVLDDVMSDESVVSKALAKCSSEEKIKAFGVDLMGALMAAGAGV